jgi:2-polyprenyl-3-methyl-5-hydroxy-6-metoxy-1,4-benzoquinol methylase
MLNFSKRSFEKELLDDEHIPFEDIKLNLKELNSINTLLGGHNITIKGLGAFKLNTNTVLHICEIGCGGGDNLIAIKKKLDRIKQPYKLIGIDMKKACVDYAALQPALKHCEFICNDYAAVNFEQKPDIIFSSLFCHHFNNEQLVQMLRWMQQNSKLGFFINDLQRNKFAYYAIKWLTRFFSNSYLVKNDAPLSVARGFHKIEWQQLLAKAGVNATVSWKWAFRYLVVGKNK